VPISCWVYARTVALRLAGAAETSSEVTTPTTTASRRVALNASGDTLPSGCESCTDVSAEFSHPAGGATTKKKRVDRITCEEFVALDPDDQQRIAYWIDGYQVAKGAAAVGTVAFDKCGQPIDALV